MYSERPAATSKPFLFCVLRCRLSSKRRIRALNYKCRIFAGPHMAHRFCGFYVLEFRRAEHTPYRRTMRSISTKAPFARAVTPTQVLAGRRPAAKYAA